MKYFSMFSGIGGFERGIESSIAGAECVGYSEIDKYASAIYSYHYPNHTKYGDATEIDVSGLPDFELLVGGFPCQTFSVAGKRGGFKDTRGTLFFDVARVLEGKRPEWFLLENVKGLCSHDGGRTLGTIYRVLTDLGYTVGWQVVNSCQFGVPQNRERIFIVGHLTAAGGRAGEVLPVGETDQGLNEGAEQASVARTFTAGGNSGGLHSSMTLIADSGKGRKWEERDIAATLRVGTAPGQHQKVVSGTWRTHNDGRGFRELENPDISPCIPARAREDGSGQPVHGVQVDSRIRRLTPVECERLQGFPDGWTSYGLIDGEKVEISDTQRYKALGNAVTVNVIEAIVGEIQLQHEPKTTQP